jgi:glutamate formiminotransferase / 5-formyltetrahydrofolate cyclo-ligase
MAADLVQCVPNFSEGRDRRVIEALAEAVRETAGVVLVDSSADPDHNRTVLTYLGEPGAVARASQAVARVAVERIDLTRHQGVHPRMGALDVLPFVPVGETPLQTCIRLAREVGAWLGGELGLPVYYYEEAATRPERKNLALVRGAGFEALVLSRLTAEREPDEGPPELHPTAGAVAVGARGPLLAYNVNLHTTDVAVARAIARRVRERDGGLVGVKALGLFLDSQGRAQVSLNVTRPAQVPLYRVYELVKLEAARYGVSVAGSELIGALRLEELVEVARYYLGLQNLQPGQVLDLWAARLEGAGAGDPEEPEGLVQGGEDGPG